MEDDKSGWSMRKERGVSLEGLYVITQKQREGLNCGEEPESWNRAVSGTRGDIVECGVDKSSVVFSSEYI